ncbi:MAG: helix-turn-helix domain-containing protein [bacterium]
MQTQYLSVSETAQELSLTRSDVKKLIGEGKLIAYTFGNDLRVNVVDLQNFIKKSKVEVSMNSYELATKYLFHVVQAWSTSGEDGSLAQAHEKISAVFPAGSQAYQQHKEEILNDSGKNQASASSTQQATPSTNPASAGLSAGDRLNKLIEAKILQNPKMSYMAAFNEVQVENPELTKQYEQEIYHR